MGEAAAPAAGGGGSGGGGDGGGSGDGDDAGGEGRGSGRGGGGGGGGGCGGGGGRDGGRGGGGAATSGAALRYGLVVWLRAETAEALAADLRALVTDHGIGVQGLRNEEVVAEVRSRLFRTRWPWLLVFDNVSSARLVEQTGVLPRGCHGVGHVLITSRQLSEASGASSLGQLAACRAVVQVGGAEAY